jgi:hypothetical protein
MSRENDALTLRGRLAVTLALWDYEREQILEALGVDASEINARAWSTGALVEEIKDCIEGHKMLASVLPANKPANGALSGEVSREEIEDWLNDIPLFD